MMKAWLLIAGFFALAACSRHRMPSDILPQARMQAILWDMMRADEFIITYASKDSGYNKKDGSLQLYEQIYRIHNTTKAQFKKSLSYYNRDPELFKVILDSLEKKKSFIMQEQYKKISSDTSKKRIRLGGPR